MRTEPRIRTMDLEIRTLSEKTGITLVTEPWGNINQSIKISLLDLTQHTGISNPNNVISSTLKPIIQWLYGYKSRSGSLNNQIGMWPNTGISSPFPSAQRRDFSQNTSYHQPRNVQPKKFAFRRHCNRPTSGFLNKNFYRRITICHPMWSASLQQIVALTNYQNFGRWTIKVCEQ